VKASRLFAGHDHELFVKKLGAHFQCGENRYLALEPDPQMIERWARAGEEEIAFLFSGAGFLNTYEETYHAGMAYLLRLQKRSTELALGNGQVKKIFVDGGFSRNRIFMQLMARSFPQMELYAASLAQASALGAALSIHRHWNKEDKPAALPELKRYTA
jgi:sugar (pentulose or hexulose) kinase